MNIYHMALLALAILGFAAFFLLRSNRPMMSPLKRDIALYGPQDATEIDE